MNRAQWRREVKRGEFPAGLRIARATLLLLPMTAEGIITATNEEMAEQTGLPVRTLSRHLAKAVDAGWLERITRGGIGARSRYRAAVPGVRHDWPTPQSESAPDVTCSEAGKCATTGRTSAPESTHSRPERVRHLMAESIKDSANVSEHRALDQSRDRRPDHDGSRADVPAGEPKDGSDRQAPADPAAVADSPAHPATIATRRRGLALAFAALGCTNCQRAVDMAVDPAPCADHQQGANSCR